MAIVAVVWVIPIVRGPTLECVDTDPAICEDIWRRTFENEGGLLPGTGIEAESVGSMPCRDRITEPISLAVSTFRAQRSGGNA
jgi:hypothetical protein